MTRSIKLGSIFGIPFGVNYTWFIIFVLVTFSLAAWQFPLEYPRWSDLTYWVAALITSLIFFASVVAHELAHSLVSQAYGVPVKSITLFIFGGVAQISREATKPKNELLMALAGPASSLMLAMAFGVLYFAIAPVNEFLGGIASWLARVNLILAAFNLVPGFPLDGGRVLRSIIWWVSGSYHRATRIATWSGQAIAYGLIFGGILYGFTSGHWLDGLWLAFIGWFLDNAADSSYRQLLLTEGLRGVLARDLMTQDCPLITGGLTLSELFRDYIAQSGRRCFLVIDGGSLIGLITLSDLKGIGRERWDAITVSQAMTPRERLRIAAPTDDAATLLERMDEHDINQLPVVEDGGVVGLVARDHLLRLIRTRGELGLRQSR